MLPWLKIPNPPPISADDDPLTEKIRSIIFPFPIERKERERKKNKIKNSNLVRDLITAAVEDAAGLWALMGRGGNRI